MSPGRTVFGIEKERPEKAVEKILVNFLSSIAENPESMVKSLTSQLMSTVLEITDATVLLHVHCDNIEEASILLGTSDEGILFEGIENPAKAIFVLLSPASDSPENHLKTLSDIARFVLSLKNTDTLNTLGESPSAQDYLSKIISHNI
jgi:mannitol/fructose-specific phosphotransferase system IIA component (Ntr-type)